MKLNSHFQPEINNSGRKNDPGKIDPTKQDERDNDATRIRPQQDTPQTPAKPQEPAPNPGTPGESSTTKNAKGLAL